EFSAGNLLWMERGGVYAQPSLRGGGEYGEAWHEAGTRTRKQNVFDDFISAAEWLVLNQYTSSSRLGISGGSNGGLLVAACELQRPDLFGAAIASVGVMDMLRFDKFTIGWAWKTDYGAPSENEEEFRAILRYSPLHTIRTGVAYPPTLITTADHDDRVYPAHSFKYAAALQAAQSGPNPILIRVETRAGHGSGMPLAKRVEIIVDQLTFLSLQLHI
ncbi:MAG TPA: prolyl oligopeptidase family serine peptidase, partial [Edaphobacter sp.]|nr:prolyl oligopeptidase family serine peptidase [Edaphobacter sp.]